MPGVLLNRLSRAKEGTTPEEQLAKGRAILLGEMLPVIAPDAVEGTDYIYLEDIASRMNVHKEGEILHKAMSVIGRGQCSWIAVTEIARLSGDAIASEQLLRLCADHRVPIYTHERLLYPYQPWLAESEMILAFQFFISRNEILNYKGRSQRAFAAAYPIDPKTGESRMKTMMGLGRHLNGRVPYGYVWNKATKQPEADTRIPCPEYIPPGATTPPAFTMFEIVKRLRTLGRDLGARPATETLYRETGYLFSYAQACAIWRNPFYAQRPTSRSQVRGGKQVRRPVEEEVSTIGTYPAMDSWEEHCALQACVCDRQTKSPKTESTAWATGIVRCACGQPFISYGILYACRGYSRNRIINYSERRTAAGRPGGDRHSKIDGWEITETCGEIRKAILHAHVEGELRRLFGRPDIAAQVVAWSEDVSRNAASHQQMRAQLQTAQNELEKTEQKRKRLVSLAVDGDITQADLRDRVKPLEKERTAWEARCARLSADLLQPAVSSTSIQLVQSILSRDFDLLWHDDEILSPSEKGIIARTLIASIPVIGRHKLRTFLPAIYGGWHRPGDT